MKQRATYTGWDFDNIWYIEEDVSYPRLRWQQSLQLTISNSTPVAGESVTLEAEVLQADGSLNEDVNGEKTMVLRGYTPAPDGSSLGRFVGEELEVGHTFVKLEFIDGQASAELILYHAAEQRITLATADEGLRGYITVTPQPDEWSKLTWKRKPSSLVMENVPFEGQPIVQLADAYLNPIDGVNSGEVRVAVLDPDPYALSGTMVVPLVDGAAVFTDLTLRGLGADAVLRFTLDIDGTVVSFDSDSITVSNRFAGGDGTEVNPYEIDRECRPACIDEPRLERSLQVNSGYCTVE